MDMVMKHFAPVVSWWENRVEIKDSISAGSLTETWKSQCVSAETIAENGYALSYCNFPNKERVILNPDELLVDYFTKRDSLNAQLNKATEELQGFLSGEYTGDIGNVGILAKRLAELNNQFPTDMRYSLLKAAVKGALTEQLEADSAVTITAVSDNIEVPYDIPSTWKWAYLKDICIYLQRGKSPKYSPIEQIPVIAQKCNQWSGFQIEKAQFIEPSTLSAYTKERILQDGDILINSTGLGTLGRIAIYPEHDNPYGIAVADSHVTVVRLNKDIMHPEFFYMFWANPSVQFVIESQATGSTKQKELGLKTIQNYFVPVPPIEEQMRIIEKMRNLLPACTV